MTIFKRASRVVDLVALSLLAVVVPPYAGGVPCAFAANAVLFGAYDPSETLGSIGRVSIDHIFVSWRHIDVASLRAAGNRAAARHRTLLITMEPWNGAAAWTSGGDQRLSEVAAGASDLTIRSDCAPLAGIPTEVIVRWGHEMDDATGRYPWANQSSADYVSAFRHFVDLCRRTAPRVKFMWSPDGNWSAGVYYPGADYVDYVGLSDFGLQKWDLDHGGKARSFADSLRNAYGRVASLGKPVILAEFGAAGDDGYRQKFICDATHASSEFPLLKAVIYFNRVETYHWPAPYGSPDWRIPASLVSPCL
jgi:beta-mannanase